MGTRHLTCVLVDDKIRVAQYGQWDGYPDGAGSHCCNFIKENDMGSFAEKVRQTTELSDDEIEDRWRECGADGSGFVNMEVSDDFEKKYPQLHRNCGANILDLIAIGVTEVSLSTEFAADSLFCEWVWLLNLDNQTLEVYEGFQKSPHEKGRFHSLESRDTHSGGTYYPVALTHVIPFDEIKANGKQSLLDLYQEAEAE
ncbi:MAG: hypothetical protein CMK32_08235 [Porticoccaceae bacterium]|nr:hypothetical protein [Porticoccaceae bacterium]